MNETTKSLIRHALTALGFFLGLIGVGKASGIIDILLSNLDGLWEAAMSVVGVVMLILGFLKDKTRFSDRVAGASKT